MDTTATPNLLPHLWKSTLLSGIFALILGALILLFQGGSILAAAILLGVYLVVTGIAQVVFAFSLHISAGGRVLLFISGAAALVLAVLCFRHFGEGYAVLLLAIWIGVGFIFRGVAMTVSAVSDPDVPGRGWNAFVGVLSLLAGLVMLAAPLSSLWALTLLVGVWLIVLGIFEIVSSFSIRQTSTTVDNVRSHG
jgi:uncharacterized membrane protein HdeD (DUF308 family)